jgi:exosortase/archaeosortase family protein
VFGFLIILFYILWISSFGSTLLFGPVINFYATASGKLLTWLGYNISVTGTLMRSPTFNLNIKRGCDAIEATALFVSAILAFPVPFRKKILGLIIGIITLVLVNFIRIITLFITVLKHPALFSFMHDQIWQIIYIAIAVLLLLLWLQSLHYREG